MTLSPPPARLLWDKGGLWSLMTLEACAARGLALTPISAAQIAAGGLAGARLLVVPGGYASLKKEALGRNGAHEIRRFVEQGGRYLGLCGGAGLALSVPDGLGLVKLGRAQGAQRLPGLSGEVLVRPARGQGEHSLWQGQKNPSCFHVWWPGQFAEPESPEVKVLARYQGPGPDLCVADLMVNQTDPADWPALEAAYHMALDPDCLWGQPAAIRAKLGRGRLLLTYLHLDTMDSESGGQTLMNLWQGWLGDGAQVKTQKAMEPKRLNQRAAHLASRVRELWDLGRELGLWQPRHPIMPLWRRGARGLEFWSLLRLSQAVAEAAGQDPETEQVLAQLEDALGPVLRNGPRVLRAQAARLTGEEPEPKGAEIEAAWFSAPRRVGGDLAKALGTLEAGLATLLSSAAFN